MDAELVRKLHEPRYLQFLPPGYEAGEDDQFRTVRSRVLTFVVAETPFEFIEPDRIDELVAAAGNTRDRFLVALVAMTGARIGETLGLHRQDMHLLTDSRSLGCPVAGPHLHLRRRPDNANDARTVSHATVSSNAALNRAPGRAHGTCAVTTPCSRSDTRVTAAVSHSIVVPRSSPRHRQAGRRS